MGASYTNILLSRILTYLNGTLLHDGYYKFCVFIIEHYIDMEDISLEEIISQTDVSREEILSFCALLGFDSYESFQEYLVQSHYVRLNQIHARMLGMNSEMLISEFDGNLTFNAMEEHISKVCRDIFKAKRVVLFGALYPLSITVELQTDLISFGKPVIQYHSYDPIKLDKDDVAIVISATGRAINDFIKKENLNLKEATSILITQNNSYLTHNNEIASHVICLPGRFDGIHFNYQIMMICDLLRVHYYRQYYQ